MRDERAPDWLPDLLPMVGEWSAYADQLYAAFCADLVHSGVRHRGRRVGVRKEPRAEGKIAGFWHAISEGPTEDDRIPDPRRCERVRWIRALIERGDDGVATWQVERGSESRIVIALPDFNYVVVLAVRKNYVQFITAYCVEREHRRDKLKKQLDAWNKAQKG